MPRPDDIEAALHVAAVDRREQGRLQGFSWDGADLSVHSAGAVESSYNREPVETVVRLCRCGTVRQW